MQGKWSGYNIEVTDGNKLLRIRTLDGVRGVSIPVAVSEADGIWSATDKAGHSIEIIEVIQYTTLFKRGG